MPYYTSLYYIVSYYPYKSLISLLRFSCLFLRLPRGREVTACGSSRLDPEAEQTKPTNINKYQGFVEMVPGLAERQASRILLASENKRRAGA